MISYKNYILFLLTLFISSCKVTTPKVDVQLTNENSFALTKSLPKETGQIPSDTSFVSLKSFSADFVYDMKYATTDNFLKQAVYDCPECYLRYKTVKSLIEANSEFMTKGYKIKLFDCYRPLSIQKKMWQIVSNPIYVADPSKGSIHNRGCAIDITLVSSNGQELDMGTPFDFFGEESSHNYQNLSEEIKRNRAYLKEVMLKHNFKSFDSEWWHYNLVDGNLEKLANFNWKCD